jgi:hypothetical protein
MIRAARLVVPAGGAAVSPRSLARAGIADSALPVLVAGHTGRRGRGIGCQRPAAPINLREEVMNLVRSTLVVKSVLCSALATLCLMSAVPQAHAVTGALCIKNTLNGSLKLRATGICKSKEIQIGSFDGTTLQFSGINVQVVSGAGKTDGAVNGKGNLIVGYNEPGSCVVAQTLCNSNADCGGSDSCAIGGPKTGSHNLIVGAPNSYSAYGGFVAGFANAISGAFASVSGGASNTASGGFASVSGGVADVASGDSSWASGGQNNTASGTDASATGGQGNTASGPGASVTGGQANIASGGDATVSGGEGNNASGAEASISGGLLLSQPAFAGWAAGSAEPGNVVVGNFESP